MDKNNYMRFYINDVLQMDFPNLKHYGIKNGEEYVDCPFCNRKKKMNISYAKNVFRCNACDKSGGVLKLHMYAKGFDTTKQAYADLKKNFTGIKNETENQKEYTYIYDDKENNPFPSFMLDKIYTNLLNLLTLNDEDKKDLLNRGLTEEDIIKNQYRTFPSSMYTFLAEKALFGTIQAGEIKTLCYYAGKLNSGMGIPGFYSTHGDITLVHQRNRGFLIPIRNIQGEITSLQIRNFLSENATEEEKETFSKYIWLSSKMKHNGCGVHEVNQIHFTGFEYQNEKSPKNVFLTEGCLKANVASSLMKQLGLSKTPAPFIAIMGVNNTAQLEKVCLDLKERGTKEITLCFDMDFLTNQNVKKAKEKVIRIIKESGLTLHIMNWDEKYKGIDDYLLAKLKNRT